MNIPNSKIGMQALAICMFEPSINHESIAKTWWLYSRPLGTEKVPNICQLYGKQTSIWVLTQPARVAKIMIHSIIYNLWQTSRMIVRIFSNKSVIVSIDIAIFLCYLIKPYK